MAIKKEVNWPVCDQGDCIGVRLESGTKCLAHSGTVERDAALQLIKSSGNVDLRGVKLDSSLLQQVLSNAPIASDDRPAFNDVRFHSATFESDASFHSVIFQRRAFFYGAAFHGKADFTKASFREDAWFSEADFLGEADFAGATVGRDAWFNEASFQDKANFSNMTVSGNSWFTQIVFRAATFIMNANFQRALFIRTIFGGSTAFGGSLFQGDAIFAEAVFRRNVGFQGVTFRRNVMYDHVTFWREAAFFAATFEHAYRFGPVLAHRGLDLDGVQFSTPIHIEASTIGLCCRHARFLGGVQFRLRWARVVLDDSDLSGPSMITGVSDGSESAAEQRIVRAWRRLLGDRISERPKLLSLQHTNVAGLGLANLDLTECRFTGAHNLDELRLGDGIVFAFSPARAGWERRQVIAEESAWRAARGKGSTDWTAPSWPDWANGKPTEELRPAAIAGLYRALRKGREDAKDEPDAADFYYGEMEMRRHSQGSRFRVERTILTAYWLVSGYGLRAWRSILWLIGTVGAFAIAFHIIGFAKPPKPMSYWTSLLYAFRSTISLTNSQVQLTAWGQLLQALLRLAGPLLIALTLLALRGRVKR